MFRRIRLRVDADVQTRLEGGRPDVLNHLQHVVCTVDDVRSVILEREDDALVLRKRGQLANGVDDERASVFLPVPILVEAVRVVVGAAPVMDRHAPPGREDLADRRAEIAREPDALANVADHGLALRAHGARKVAVRRHRADWHVQFTGEIAQPLAIVRG
jgi:hypothetical protein